MTSGQARGALAGAVIGGVVLATLFTPLAFIPIAEVAFGARLVAAIGVGFIAGAVAGAVFGGGWQSDRDGARSKPEPEIIVGYTRPRGRDPMIELIDRTTPSAHK